MKNVGLAKTSIFIFPFSWVMLNACDQNQTAEIPEEPRTDTVADATDVEKEKVEIVRNCYAWIKGKDTIALSLERTGNMVTGEMNYLWNEKDSNHGTVKGEVRGDTLVLDYTFMAEGMESVRKEFLLKQGEGYVIGQIDYGHDQEPYQAKNARYKGEMLKKIDCK